MFALERSRGLPRNLDEFVSELASGFGAVYGPEAEKEYRDTATPRLLTAFLHPGVEVVACFDDNDTAGILWYTVRDGIGHIGFIHVLKRYAGRGIEDRLVGEAVESLRRQGVRAILCECLSFGSPGVAPAFHACGLERVERLLMAAPADAPLLAGRDDLRSTVCEHLDLRLSAEVVAEAYIRHPDRLIHPDLHHPAAVLRFFDTARQGGYGHARPEYIRACWDGDRATGVVVGCEAAHGTGFVLQVAVRPAYQGRGIGTCLLQELAGLFRANGLSRIALGVTTSNPARRLYERLGFRAVRPVDCHVWWRP